jgi:hypothetical protein
VPRFVRGLIRLAWSPRPADRPSFRDIFEELSENKFMIMEGVDSEEVGDFVRSFGQGV